MQNENDTIIYEEVTKLRFYREELEEVTVEIPKLTYKALEKIAKHRKLPVLAVVKLYIGQGMRNDMSEKESSELAKARLKARKRPNELAEIDLAA